MPRTARASVGNVCYHVLNRGNARNEVFHQDEDYGSFLKLLNQANERVSMRLLSFCLMPNHPESLDAVADDVSRSPLPSPLRFFWARLARTIQGVPDSIRRTPVNGDALRGTKSSSRQNHSNKKGAKLELVFGRHSTFRLRSGKTSCRPN